MEGQGLSGILDGSSPMHDGTKSSDKDKVSVSGSINKDKDSASTVVKPVDGKEHAT